MIPPHSLGDGGLRATYSLVQYHYTGLCRHLQGALRCPALVHMGHMEGKCPAVEVNLKGLVAQVQSDLKTQSPSHPQGGGKR